MTAKGSFKMTVNRVYNDEKTYVNRPMRIINAFDMQQDESREPGVIPHNTLRFDVQLAHVYAMLDDGSVTKEAIASAIRKAIVTAVEATIGAGLDGCSIPGGAFVSVHRESVMLHRESISFDLS